MNSSHNCPQQTLSLPLAQRMKIKATILSLSKNNSPKVHTILSCIGKLQWSCDVLWFAPCYLHALRRLVRGHDRSDFVPLSKEALFELQRFSAFLKNPPERPFSSILDEPPVNCEKWYSDASGLGCGGHFKNCWFQHRWSYQQRRHTIVWQELFGVLHATKTFVDQHGSVSNI